MAAKQAQPSAAANAEILRQRRNQAARQQQSYRERALRMFPHLCASCGREFAGKRLKELTVHHKDHDHTNNSPDGSNWELLCLYCHDHEHEKYKMMEYRGGARPENDEPAPSTFSPFEGLDDLLKGIPGTEPDDSGAGSSSE